MAQAFFRYWLFRLEYLPLCCGEITQGIGMHPVHVLAVIGINAMFGSAFALGKIGVDHFPPFFFTAMRSVLIVACLLPFLRLAPIERRHWKPLLLFTLSMGILVFVTMYSALQLTSSVSPIVIGTQLVAKGHNFPLLTLVGVIDADLGLQGSDLRAAERTFQLMRQVAGRAGRSEKPGLALLQTFQPEHPVIRAILGGDEEAFWRAEAEERRAAGMPPYGRLAGIILSGPEPGPIFDLGNVLARNDAALRQVGAQVYGPAPAPIARVRGRHRVRLLVKAPKGVALQQALTQWVAPLRLKGDIRLAIDIDPQNFF